MDILLKNKQIIKIENIEEICKISLDFHLMQLTDYDNKTLYFLENQYQIDTSILKAYKDIEISSHFLFNEHQVAFHISIPFYNEKKELEERPIFFILLIDKLFIFLDKDIDTYFNRIYTHKITQLQQVESIKDILKLQIEFISDYYADITEAETKQIKSLSNNILLKQNFSDNATNTITKLVFNNMLIKEMLIETTRVFTMYKKNSWLQKIDIEQTIDRELNDLSVISDYIQFNFQRLENLKENVSNKIEIEQNHIFKVLTIITLCISLPTLIAGIYGMNFENMPELSYVYGYPLVILAMMLSAILPFFYFKHKKWF